MLVKAVKRAVIVVCLCDSIKYCVSLQSVSPEGNKDQCRPDSPETCAQKRLVKRHYWGGGRSVVSAMAFFYYGRAME